MKVRNRSSRTPLGRQRVIAAALTIADQEGLDAVSMRRLGQELGVEAMSLYKHVASKEDILEGIVDLAVSEIEAPEPGAPWKPALRARCRSAHQVLLKHRWATQLIVSRANVGPAMLRYVDRTLGCLRGAGFTYAMADHAWNALDNHVYGFTLQQLNFPFQPEEYAAAAAQFLPQLSRAEFPHLYALSEQVIAGEHSGLHDFELGLTLILDGLERLLRASRRATGKTRRRDPG